MVSIAFDGKLSDEEKSIKKQFKIGFRKQGTELKNGNLGKLTCYLKQVFHYQKWRKLLMTERRAAYNNTYPKVAVQWLNQALCFYQRFWLVDSEVLRNRHLRVAAKR